MKVVAINGSPRKDGNCAQMLEVLGKVFEQEGIEFEVCQPGAKVHPCKMCIRDRYKAPQAARSGTPDG